MASPARSRARRRVCGRANPSAGGRRSRVRDDLAELAAHLFCRSSATRPLRRLRRPPPGTRLRPRTRWLISLHSNWYPLPLSMPESTLGRRRTVPDDRVFGVRRFKRKGNNGSARSGAARRRPLSHRLCMWRRRSSGTVQSMVDNFGAGRGILSLTVGGSARRARSARYSSMVRLRSIERRPSSLWTKPTLEMKGSMMWIFCSGVTMRSCSQDGEELQAVARRFVGAAPKGLVDHDEAERAHARARRRPGRTGRPGWRASTVYASFSFWPPDLPPESV